MKRFGLLGIALWAMLQVAAAVLPQEAMTDPKDDARARSLYQEVRCVVCQNESIAGSSADMAADLRRDIRGHISEGLSDSEIRDRLRARYGDYVLFRPGFSLSTALLWLTPLGVLIIGGIIFGLTTKSRQNTESEELTDEERARLEDLTKPQA